MKSEEVIVNRYGEKATLSLIMNYALKQANGVKRNERNIDMP